ncbi:Unknown protein [Striga hermonthica]|uniref:No apical meristem-associated C-terminal domain-containing protein n=1 Tax=Striga hermonthica TaxID=68872 RepID=A0A9N7N5B4_STRHE|nr:Unknown protein [Striga hermonthica]
MEISQDPVVGVNQIRAQFWDRVTNEYNSKKPNPMWPDRPQRSIQCRTGIINTAVKLFKSCVQQIENAYISGASEHDVMERAKILFMQDPKNRTSQPFKYERVWTIMKDSVLFECTSQRRSSTMSQHSGLPESPISPNPELSNFSINLSDENTSGGTSSQRPEGVKKSKLKRKIGDDDSVVVKTIKEENE